MIINRQKDALTTDMNLDEFGKAMAALDLSSVPLDKRPAAIRHHLMRIMVGTIHDRRVAADIAAARLLFAKLNV